MTAKFSAKRPLSDEEEAAIQKMIRDDPDDWEVTDEELARARPFAEVFPGLHETIRRSRGRPSVARPRKQISIRLDQDVIDKFKATGRGWQNRINEVLKQAKI